MGGTQRLSGTVIAGIAVALVVGFAVALVVGIALLPTSGVDTYPPVCWAAGGYEVPCATGPSWTAVLGGGALAAAAAWRLLRPVRA